MTALPSSPMGALQGRGGRSVKATCTESHGRLRAAAGGRSLGDEAGGNGEPSRLVSVGEGEAATAQGMGAPFCQQAEYR